MSGWQKAGGGSAGGKKKGGKGGAAAAAPAAAEAVKGPQPTTIYEQYEQILALKEQRAREALNPKKTAAAEPAVTTKESSKGGKKDGNGGGGAAAKGGAAAGNGGGSLEERVKALNADALQAAFEAAKDKFPEAPVEWVKALADALIDGLGDAALDERDDTPLRHVSEPVKAGVVGMLASAHQAQVDLGAEMLADAILRAMAMSKEKKKPVAGLYLFMQLLLVLDASARPQHIVARAAIALRRALKDRLRVLTIEEAVPLLRVLRQVAAYAPHTFLLVWKFLLLPVVVGEAAEDVKDLATRALLPFCAEKGEQLGKMVQMMVSGLRTGSPLAFKVDGVPGGLMNAREYGAFLMAGYGNSSPNCTDGQKQILRRATPLIREIMLRHPVGLECLPVMLGLLVRLPPTDTFYQEVLHFVVRAVLLHPRALDIVLGRLRLARAPGSSEEGEGEEGKEEETKEKDKGKDKKEKDKEREKEREREKRKARMVEGVMEVQRVVGAVGDALARGWPVTDPSSLTSFLRAVAKEAGEMLASAEDKEALGSATTAAQSLVKQCKALTTQLSPPDDSAWLLWVALVAALSIFIILLAHLACRPVTGLALPEQVCNTLNDLGFLSGVDRFYELVAPLAPHLESALAHAQPYAESAITFARPYVHMLGDLAGDAAQAATPYVQKAVDYVNNLRKA